MGDQHEVEEETVAFINPQDTPVENSEELPRESPKPSSFKNQIIATLIASTGAFSTGTFLGWTSPAIPDIKLHAVPDLAELTDVEFGWISSIAPLGALCAAFIAGLAMDSIGRKLTMLFLCLPFTIGWVIMATSRGFIQLLIGRFITGFCGGAYTVVIPVYVSEISDGSIRGRLGNAVSISICSGILFVYFMGAFFSWIWLSIICATLPLISVIGMVFLPESPRYLLAKKRRLQAGASIKHLQNLTSDEDVDERLEEIETYMNQLRLQRVTWTSFFERKTIFPITLSVILMLYQQLDGINAVIFNSVQIFQEAGSNIPDVWATVILASVQVLVVGLSSLLVDRMGRRPLLMISAFGMTIGLVVLGGYFWGKSNYPPTEMSSYGWVPLSSLLWYIVFYNLGLGPLPWLLMAELTPPHVKGLASAISTASNWMTAFIVIMTFPLLKHVLGMNILLWIYSAICITGVAFVYIFVPETKGRSLEEIQQLF